MSGYQRVIPRDLCNEAKLLKSLGQLALLIHDGFVPFGLTMEYYDEDQRGFEIMQDPSDGSLFVANLAIRYLKKSIPMSSRYNLRDTYNLWHLGEEQIVPVLDEKGQLHKEFYTFLKELRHAQTK